MCMPSPTPKLPTHLIGATFTHAHALETRASVRERFRRGCIGEDLTAVRALRTHETCHV